MKSHLLIATHRSSKGPITLGLILFVFAILVGHRAQADGNTYAVGLDLGVSAVNNNGGTNATFGISGDYQLMPEWSLGFDWTTNSVTMTAPVTSTMALTTFNVKYFFAFPGFYGSLKAGSAASSYSGTGAPASTSNFAWGPAVGYVYPLGDWSIAGELADLMITNTTPASTSLQVLANLNYLF